MKIKVAITILVGLAALSCTSEDILNVDRELSCSADYETTFRDSLSTLTRRLHSAGSDEGLRWETALTLYDAYSHYQLDSAFEYASLLDDIAGSDATKRVIALSCKVKSLQSLEAYSEAVDLYETIDISGADLGGDASSIYRTAGVWAYRGASRMFPSNLHYKTALVEAEHELSLLGEKDIEAVNLMYGQLCGEGRYGEALALVKRFMNRPLTLNEQARSYYWLSNIFSLQGDRQQEIRYLALSAQADIKAAVKNYNSLYNLAMLLYERGDYRRASLYMQKNLDDALFSNSSHRMLRSARSEMLFSEALQKSERNKSRILGLVVALALALAFVLTGVRIRDRRHLRELEAANRNIHDLSRIKDSFLGKYMELSSTYIGKVDETRSHLRQTLKKDGIDALKAELRAPSFADSESENFYRNFDETFLGIFPDFIHKVNSLMKPECRFPEESTILSTQLRILALIRLGITQRARISEILHVSPQTVYTYHSRTLKGALPSDKPFDEKVMRL